MHHKEKGFELKLQQIDSRSQIIPYFVLSLDDDGLKILNHRKIIELSLINIGKESVPSKHGIGVNPSQIS